MPPRDTSPEIARLMQQAYIDMGMSGRLRIALELSDFVHALAVSGIRQRNPELSEEEAYRKLAEMLYGVTAPR